MEPVYDFLRVQYSAKDIADLQEILVINISYYWHTDKEHL